MAGEINSLLSQHSAPDFNDPLGLLKACHQRILGFCELLEKIVTHFEQYGVDDDIKQSAQKVHRYFSTAAILHHQDEEQDLFPLLISSSLKMASVIADLKKDHSILDKHWERLAPVLSKPASIAKTTDFKIRVDEFCAAYRQHIKTEEQDLLSTAQHLLNHTQLEHLGSKMRQRRKNF